MNCPVCNRYCPPDPETGYDADDICPSCEREGWTLAQVDGEVVVINEQWLAAQADPRRV